MSGLSGDEDDDTCADAAKDVGERGCGAGADCIPATSTLTPTSPCPPYLLTACSGGASSAAGDWLDFSLGLRDIFLHTWHLVRALAVSSRPSSTRAPHLAVSSVPLFARPLCAVLPAYRCSWSSSMPLRTVDTSQAAAGHVLDGFFLVLAPLASFFRVRLRLLVPLGCPFFLPCVIRHALVGLLGHQLAVLPRSAPLGPAQRRSSVSGSSPRHTDFTITMATAPCDALLP